jgi:hypothetical protein
MSSERQELAGFMRTTAVGIDREPEAETRARYSRFLVACIARTEREVLDHQADMDAYAEARDKDLADYERAQRAEASGELHTAAEWYRKAAGNDFADSALRLAEVLERIAERHLSTPGGRAAASELHLIIEEASKSYIAALMVGDISFDEWEIRHERLLSYLNPAGVPTRPVLTIAVSADEPAANDPKSRAESASIATADGEAGAQSPPRPDRAPGQQSRR